MVRVFVLLLLSLPSLAAAQDYALVAADIHNRYCANTRIDDIGTAGESFVVVGREWAAMDGVPERTGDTSLYYWRGLLAECLSRDEPAMADLATFLRSHGDDPVYAQLARDARRRLARLQRGPTPAVDLGDPRRVPGYIAGGALAAGGGVLGALAGVRWSQATAAEREYYSGTLSTTELAQADAYGQRATNETNGLLAGAIGAGTAGVTSAVLALALRFPSGGVERAPSLSLDVRHDRWLVSVGGRW